MSECRINPAEPENYAAIKADLAELAVQQGASDEKSLSKHFELACDETGFIKAEAILEHSHGIGKIDSLSVHEDYRRRGNGRELLSAIEDFARANGILSLHSETTTFGCSELYKHCGYAELGRIPTAVRINGVQQQKVFFTKILSP